MPVLLDRSRHRSNDWSDSTGIDQLEASLEGSIPTCGSCLAKIVVSKVEEVEEMVN